MLGGSDQDVTGRADLEAPHRLGADAGAAAIAVVGTRRGNAVAVLAVEMLRLDAHLPWRHGVAIAEPDPPRRGVDFRNVGGVGALESEGVAGVIFGFVTDIAADCARAEIAEAHGSAERCGAVLETVEVAAAAAQNVD